MAHMTLHYSGSSIEQHVLPAVRDLGGGFNVRRALPSAQRRMVGPFIFLDSFGPVVFASGEGLDTRPHPHIGLSTLTYLLEGELLHRDSEGYVQTILPGEINLMTAGRGIVHSERTSDSARQAGSTVFGFQAWLALPVADEEIDPGFQHISAEHIPVLEGEGVRLALLAGSLHGQHASTRIHSDLFYADLVLQAGVSYPIRAEHIERAVYVVSGEITVRGQDGCFGKDQLVIFKPDAEVIVKAHGPTRLILLGGEPLPEKRHIYWNFVSSRKDRIEQAAEDWRMQRFPGVPGEHDFIPLPDRRIRLRGSH
jgi:redox-sensitive bicupin YhaK (pirin superfamily)